MAIQYGLILWLAVLAFLASKFYKAKMIPQQRLFSICLIVWAILSIVYYDVWNYITVENIHIGT